MRFPYFFVIAKRTQIGVLMVPNKKFYGNLINVEISVHIVQAISEILMHFSHAKKRTSARESQSQKSRFLSMFSCNKFDILMQIFFLRNGFKT